MPDVLDVLNELSQSSQYHDWHDPNVQQFILTGDRNLLPRITRLREGFSWQVGKAVPAPSAWTDQAGRMLELAVRFGSKGLVKVWLQKWCRYTPEWVEFARAIKLLRAVGLPDSEIHEIISDAELWLKEEDRASPAGELLLEAPDDLFKRLFGTHWSFASLFLMARRDPDRLIRLLDSGVRLYSPFHDHRTMVRANPEQFHERAFALFQTAPADPNRASLACELAKAYPDKYRDWAIKEIHAVLKETPDDDVMQRQSCEELLQLKDPDALASILAWMRNYPGKNPWNAPHQRMLLLQELAQMQPDWVLPAAESATHCQPGNVVLLGLKFLKSFGDAVPEDTVHAAIRRLLSNADAATVISGISEATGRSLARAEEDLWPLMQHKSRPVRGAAARALAGLGEASLPKAGKLLAHKKADIRLSAVTLLEQVGTPPALAALKSLLDTEENDDVRDGILLALERKGGAVAISEDELKARITRTLEKVKGSPVPWLDPAQLTLKRTDGNILSAPEVLYLLHRQSRCKEMRADIEAKPLYATLDRPANGGEALKVLQAFLGSGQSADDRWVLAWVALIGDDRLVPPLLRAIITLADQSRGKLAEYGAQALALLGTDAALMVVDSLSTRFRSKNKNIGKAASEAFADAAERRGVTVEELGDLVVPWLGFEPGKPRVITAGRTEIEARITADFKLAFRDKATGKSVAKLPATVGAEVQAEFKELAATLKEAVKAQLLRMETLLVRQYRWPVARWRELYQGHPLLRPFTERLVWGWRGEDGVLALAFRALDDGSFTDAADETVTLPDHGTIALVHPLELEDDARAAWVQHLVDYKVEPPLPQIDRTVIRVKEDDRGVRLGKQVQDTSLNAMTFRGRAEKLGWTRGSVADAGCVTAYRKIYSGAGVEAFLVLDGMYIGIGMDDTIKLQDFFFVESGAVEVGSYTYDEPSKEDDPRLIPFGDVPAIPFSETLGDLAKISGKSLDGSADTEGGGSEGEGTAV